jgi:hypothetical protein
VRVRGLSALGVMLFVLERISIKISVLADHGSLMLRSSCGVTSVLLRIKNVLVDEFRWVSSVILLCSMFHWVGSAQLVRRN